ncbi:hypothetical protein CYMTET_28473, partial [Cymbomonas tetramitiformis]
LTYNNPYLFSNRLNHSAHCQPLYKYRDTDDCEHVFRGLLGSSTISPKSNFKLCQSSNFLKFCCAE